MRRMFTTRAEPLSVGAAAQCTNSAAPESQHWKQSPSLTCLCVCVDSGKPGGSSASLQGTRVPSSEGSLRSVPAVRLQHARLSARISLSLLQKTITVRGASGVAFCCCNRC